MKEKRISQKISQCFVLSAGQLATSGLKGSEDKKVERFLIKQRPRADRDLFDQGLAWRVVARSVFSALVLSAIGFTAAMAEGVPVYENMGPVPALSPVPTVGAVAGENEEEKALVAKGAYLARISGCIVCHTSDERYPYTGGHPLVSPVGAIYSTNITPDKETGIGGYSLEEFSRAVRQGVRKDGARLYPAMPYPSYSQMHDDDIEALYAYFMRGVAPVRSIPPKNGIPFLISMRWPVAIWDGIYVPDKPFAPDPTKSALWNRGAYIVQALGHCGACHTPRNVLFAEKAMDDKSPVYLSGASLGGWYAPPLRFKGVKAPSQLHDALRYGKMHGDSMGGSMRDMVEEATRYYSDQDMKGVVTYLTSLPGKQAILTPLQRGKEIYDNYCSVCHGKDGMGIPYAIPKLAGNKSVVSDDENNAIRTTLFGGETVISSKYLAYKMPSYSDILSSSELADVISYVRYSWGNDSSGVSASQVAKIRKEGPQK